jgi:CRISPR-associated protein Cmr2
MTAHLLAITVGPVQEFIAAARRTRDLWFGSYLLSQISKAVAKAVQGNVRTLIFPAPESDAELESSSPLNVANVILAELSSGDPAVVAQAAKDAARARWREFADVVFHDHQNVIEESIWRDQVDDVVDFYAAWHEVAPETYQADRASLMRLLSARKRCRDFMPAKGRTGVPKSSLDGLRESVLRPPDRWPEHSRRHLRIQKGEQFDVVALVKRAWSPPDGNPRYPSVARVAAEPWLRAIDAPLLEPLLSACRELGAETLHELDTTPARGQPAYAGFPFEGTAVYRSRHRDLQEEAGLSDEDIQPLARALAELTRRFGEPSPYLAVLVADGDRIGSVLSALSSADEHRDFSRALSRFAAEARTIIANHRGVLVYAGGDDVLAFVPVDSCLACARALHDAFARALADRSPAANAAPSLSVGIAIAHFMEPLEDLLGYGRAAEHHAKQPRVEDGAQQPRDGLAVHVLKRGGGPVAVRANWAENPDQHLQKLARRIGSRSISTRVAYDLCQLADVYDSWGEEIVAEPIRLDTLSVLKGKQPRGASQIQAIEALIEARVTNATSLRALANDLLIANQLATASTPREASTEDHP